jgi:hypothetical protein
MKFSIRDVLWLTVVAALAVGWSLDRMALRRAERARIAAVQARITSMRRSWHPGD